MHFHYSIRSDVWTAFYRLITRPGLGSDMCTQTQVPSPSLLYVTLEPSGRTGVVQSKSHFASSGARLMQPWLRVKLKASCQ